MDYIKRTRLKSRRLIALLSPFVKLPSQHFNRGIAKLAEMAVPSCLDYYFPNLVVATMRCLQFLQVLTPDEILLSSYGFDC